MTRGGWFACGVAALGLAAPLSNAAAAEMTRPFAAAPGKIIVAPGGSYRSLQAAVDGLSEGGGEIRLGPGVYREKVLITKPNVTLRGTGRTAGEVVIAWSDGAKQVGGTFKTATLEVRGDDFHAVNLTVANDHWLRSEDPSQAVALYITGDRAVVERVRMLGSQDTLYAASRKCAGPTAASAVNTSVIATSKGTSISSSAIRRRSSRIATSTRSRTTR